MTQHNPNFQHSAQELFSSYYREAMSQGLTFEDFLSLMISTVIAEAKKNAVSQERVRDALSEAFTSVR